MKDMILSKNDTFLASFPKSGTTWLLNIVYHIMREIEEHQKVDDMIPWLDCDPYNIKIAGSRRYFKTHVPLSWLPYDENAKYIYIARNPKDVAVSFYYFIESMQDQVVGCKNGNNINMESFIDFFADGKVLYGSWWSHVSEWYQASLSCNNILFLTYEELSKNLEKEITKISLFLGKKIDHKVLKDIAYKCTFSHMKNDGQSSMAHCRNFWRKGICNDHVNFFSKHQIQIFNEKSDKLLSPNLIRKFII